MAEGLARALLPGTRVESAGLGALVGEGAAPFAREIMQERGIDLSAHRARQLTDAIVREFELVLVMESWQVREVERISPAARGRVFRLGHWGDFEIADPYERPREAFERTLVEIEKGLADLRGALKLP